MATIKLEAAPGRVLLQFPPAVEEMNGIAIPESSQQRFELAEILHVGEATDEEEIRYRAWLLERKAAGEPVFADFGAGTPFWRANYDVTKHGFLKNIRAYRLSQPFAKAVRVEEAS